MSTWVFVRHGESEANAQGWLAGHHDVPLTPLGRAQAEALRATLAPRPLGRVLCSDLRRARDTARAAVDGRGLAITEVPALRERDLGAWACRPRQELRQSGELNVLLGWWSRPPGGESHQDLALRALRWLAQDPGGPGETLLVGHGGLNRVLLGLLDGTPLDQIGGHRIANAEVQVRTLPTGRWAALLAQVESLRAHTPPGASHGPR